MTEQVMEIRSGFGTMSGAAHRWLNRTLLVAIPIQFYTAGLFAFGAAGFMPHRVTGSVIIIAGLLSLLAATFGRKRGTRPLIALGLFTLLFLQPVLAFAPRQTVPALSAVHAVIGLFAFLLALRLERGD